MSEESVATAILIFAHGSRVEEANQGVREVARQVQEAGRFAYVRAAFLEMSQPDLPAAVAEAVADGRRRILVVPYFLTLGVHLRRDLPTLVAREEVRHPGVKIEVSEPLEGHPLLASLVLDRIQRRLGAEKSGS